MHSCKATLPPTPKNKENYGHKSKHEQRKPFKDTNNNMILSKKKKKEAVLNSIKLTPKSRTKKSYNNKREGEKTILPVRYTSHNMLLLKKAMKNSMKKKGGKEAKFANKMSIIRPKPSSPKRPRRQAFQIRPSRLSTVSDAQDLPITQSGKGPIVVDLEGNEESLVSKKRSRPTAIKVNGSSNLMTSNIIKKQSTEVAMTSKERKKRIKRKRFSQQAPKENVATLDPQTTRATFRSNHDA